MYMSVFYAVDNVYSYGGWWTVVFCIAGFFFFFSSRRRHTRCSRDWSSDVCSSDLCSAHLLFRRQRDFLYEFRRLAYHVGNGVQRAARLIGKLCAAFHFLGAFFRSEERRVGKECRSRWSPYH